MGDTRADADSESVIAALGRDLVDARDQIAATNEVLAAMGRSASDLDLVLGTIVETRGA